MVCHPHTRTTHTHVQMAREVLVHLRALDGESLDQLGKFNTEVLTLIILISPITLLAFITLITLMTLITLIGMDGRVSLATGRGGPGLQPLRARDPVRLYVTYVT